MAMTMVKTMVMAMGAGTDAVTEAVVVVAATEVVAVVAATEVAAVVAATTETKVMNTRAVGVEAVAVVTKKPAAVRLTKSVAVNP